MPENKKNHAAPKILDVLEACMQPVVFVLVSPILLATWVCDRMPVVTITFPSKVQSSKS